MAGGGSEPQAASMGDIKTAATPTGANRVATGDLTNR